MTHTPLFLETAARIGWRLERTALRHGGECSWTLSGAHAQTGDLYRGTAGIALFLCELWRATGDEAIRRAAEGAARHALRWARSLGPEHPGLFNGRMGAAWAVAHTGAAMGSDELSLAGSEGVRWAASDSPPGFDVMEGAAGVVLSLILLLPFAEGEDASAAAAAWARVLADRAVVEPWGWSWSGGQGPPIRNLLGYAHGASGAGHALLEAAGVSGEAAFRYGGEQAFLYERRFYRPEAGNWPDFRRPAEERAPPGVRSAAPYFPRFRTAWCHGATGIGLARLRAFELLGTPVYRAEAEAAVRTALRFPRGPGFNFSLCHGAGGTVELLAEAAAVLNDPALRDNAEVLAAEGCETFERPGHAWPCAIEGGRGEPGLMLGEAGIGLMLLRLAGTGAPSVLLPRAPGRMTMPPDGFAGAERLAEREVNARFGRALSAFGRLGRAQALPRASGTVPTVARAYGALRAVVSAEPDASTRARLEEALGAEGVAYEMEAGAIDRTEEAWYRGRAAEPEWELAWIGLTRLARVVKAGHGAADPSAQAESPAEGASWQLVVRTDNRARVYPLTGFAAAVLSAIESPVLLDRLIATIAESFPRETRPEPDALRTAVVGQLRAAWGLGAVRVDDEPPLEAAVARLVAAATADAAPPAAIQARDAIARQVQSARTLLEAGDPLMAHVVVAGATSELEAALHAVHARALFADAFGAVHRAAGPAARLEAFRTLLEHLARSWPPDEMMLPGTPAVA